jgi:hypothetical protein
MIVGQENSGGQPQTNHSSTMIMICELELDYWTGSVALNSGRHKGLRARAGVGFSVARV